MNVLQRKPEVVVFAGPNGSGKSTFTELLKPPLDYTNADEKRCEVLGKWLLHSFFKTMQILTDFTLFLQEKLSSNRISL